MTRVFVSHSSKDNDLTGEVCALLRQPSVTGGAALEVLVDTSKLEAGGEWPIQLHEMMADCHAAIVLLTKNAVASAWVLKETTILAWRRSLEPGFKLFVVQFPDVAEDAVKRAGYEPTQYRLVQGLPGTAAPDIAARVHAAIQQDAVQPAVTLFDRLVLTLADVLEDLSDAVLRTIAHKLDVATPAWRPGRGVRPALVDAVACRILRGRLGGYAGLTQLMNDLKATKLTADSLRTILRLTAPYWVSAQSAGLLTELVPADLATPCRAAALDGRFAKSYTGQMYVQRAFPLSFEHRVYGPPAPKAGDVVPYYTRKLAAHCIKTFRACEQMEEPEEVVEWLRQSAPFLFVVVAPLDARALSELQALFPRVRFLIDTGEAGDGYALPAGVVRLAPPVDLPAEKSAFEEYQPSLNIVAG